MGINSDLPSCSLITCSTDLSLLLLGYECRNSICVKNCLDVTYKIVPYVVILPLVFWVHLSLIYFRSVSYLVLFSMLNIIRIQALPQVTQIWPYTNCSIRHTIQFLRCKLNFVVVNVSFLCL
jgi:hypothetical protein